LFARLGTTFKSVDIDAVEYRTQDLGTRIRAVLKQRTGAATIPQIWIGGVHVGGATDLFDALRSGQMQRLLRQAGIGFEPANTIDPDEFLPKWLHPRKAA
jgi:cysteine synthase A